MATLHRIHRFPSLWPVARFSWLPIAVAVLVIAVILAIVEFLLMSAPSVVV